MHLFDQLKGKTIKEVRADTAQVGLDGDWVGIYFTDDSMIEFRVNSHNSYLKLHSKIPDIHKLTD